MIYKIILKLMVQRLNKWLKGLILEKHSGFVEGQQILDGVVFSTKTIHSMASSHEKEMFIKSNMAKAYDKVKWSFLCKILVAFRFSEEWI